MSRWRNPQLQVGENYSYLSNFRPNICKSWCLNTYFIHKNSHLIAINNRYVTHDNLHNQSINPYNSFVLLLGAAGRQAACVSDVMGGCGHSALRFRSDFWSCLCCQHSTKMWCRFKGDLSPLIWYEWLCPYIGWLAIMWPSQRVTW